MWTKYQVNKSAMTAWQKQPSKNICNKISSLTKHQNEIYQFKQKHTVLTVVRMKTKCQSVKVKVAEKISYSIIRVSEFWNITISNVLNVCRKKWYIRKYNAQKSIFWKSKKIIVLVSRRTFGVLQRTPVIERLVFPVLLCL